MKKLLLAAAVATFATSALASENFYLKAEAGASYLPTKKMKIFDEDIKFKSSNAMTAGFGVGTYVMDNVRAELVLSGTFNASQKPTVSDELIDKAIAGIDALNTAISADPTNTDLEEKRDTLTNLVDGYKNGKLNIKYNVISAHVKGLVDVVDLGYGSIFAGAGVGVSHIKAKDTDAKLTNFSYLGTVGAAMEATDGVKVELAYTYADHGKSKEFFGKKFHFTSHNVTAGLRVEL